MHAGDLVAACFACLEQLLLGGHGSARDISARVLRNLTPTLLGTSGSSKGLASRSAALLRSRTLQFATDAMR